MENVKCSQCGEVKSSSDFSRHVRSHTGYRAYCKACASAYDARYRQSETGKAKRAAHHRAYKKTEIGKLLRKVDKHRRRVRMKDAGVLTRRTLEQVLLKNRTAYGHLTCVYCKANVDGEDWHLEHLTPLSRGGTNDVGNLDIACPKCNMFKGSKLYKDFERMFEDHLLLEHAVEILDYLEEKYMSVGDE